MTSPAESDTTPAHALTRSASHDLDLLHVTRVVRLILVSWTAALALVFMWQIWQVQEQSVASLRIQAAGSFQKDVVYRRWAANHGGIYAPVTEDTPPNPYLAQVPERDITTPSGRKLTLVNPAYMTRQVHELGLREYGQRGHITSLKPLRPENAPDPWEAKALRSFEEGASEVAEITEIEGTEYLRYMRPLFTEAGCLKCHEAQGYKEGDLRGGISVAVPAAPMKAITSTQTKGLSLGYMLLWVLGLLGIGVGNVRSRQCVVERERARGALLESELRFRTLFENSPLGYQSLDEQGNLIEINRTWTELLGYAKEDALGRNFSEFLPPEQSETFAKNFREFKNRGYTLGTEFKMLRGDGKEMFVSFDGKIGRNDDGSFRQTHCVLQDITQRKQNDEEKQKLRAHLLQSQKMESIGTLAGGVAHEINNPLNIVSNCAELILDDVEAGGAPWPATSPTSWRRATGSRPSSRASSPSRARTGSPTRWPRSRTS